MIWFPVFTWKKFDTLCQTLTKSSLKSGDPLLVTFKVIIFIPWTSYTGLYYSVSLCFVLFALCFVQPSLSLTSLDPGSLDSVLDFKSYLCTLDSVSGLPCITVILPCLYY